MIFISCLKAKLLKASFNYMIQVLERGKKSPFLSYGVKNTAALNTPLQIANFNIAACLAVWVASGTLVNKTGLSVAWQPP